MSVDSLTVGLGLLKCRTTSTMDGHDDLQQQIEAQLLFVHLEMICTLSSQQSGISNFQEKLARIKRLRADLESDSTRPLSGGDAPAAPGLQYTSNHLASQSLGSVVANHSCKKHIYYSLLVLGHQFFAEADLGNHAPGNRPVARLTVDLCNNCVISCSE